MENNHKKIYLIGAGPGDPELLTIKAVRAIKESDIILYDHLVSPKILEYAATNTELFLVGKKKGNHSYPQDEINRLIAAKAKTHQVVSRLKGGDPFIFGRGGEEVEYLVNRDFHVEVIPGVTTASGASSNILLPLTHRKYSSQLILITGHKKKNGDYADFAAYDLKGKTMVIYMGLTALPEIQKELCKNPENYNVPTVIIESATLPNERMIRGVLKDILSLSEEENIKPPAIIIIGETIAFLDELKKSKK